MVRPPVEPGAVIDGFTIGERVHSGGMATLWSVTWPDIDVPVLMKVPLTSEGEDPAAIVTRSFQFRTRKKRPRRGGSA
jgi:non-specific serine/threonine protein kinase/protein-serine/threonine kinase